MQEERIFWKNIFRAEIEKIVNETVHPHYYRRGVFPHLLYGVSNFFPAFPQ